jgi:pteridine reductase
MQQTVNSKVALITGSGRRRVGNVIAVDLARSGFSVAVHYHRSADPAKETVAELQREGREAAAFRADVGDERDVDRMLDEVLAHFGRLDVLVSTAAIWSPKPLEAVTSQDVYDHFAINTLGTFLCGRRAGLIMAGQAEGGVIVNLGDWAIERPYRDYAAYFISKGSLPALTRMLAVELAARNPKVRVNCIHPGPVLLPPDVDPTERQQLIDSTLVKMADCPEGIARAVRFFIETPFVTGACLPVDGGRTIFAGEM